MPLSDYNLTNVLQRILPTFRSGDFEQGPKGMMGAGLSRGKDIRSYKNPLVRTHEAPQPTPPQRQVPNYSFEDKPPIPEDFVPYIESASQGYDIDPMILAALLAQESGGVGYDPTIRGGSGEAGVTQIMPGYHFANAGYDNPDEYASRLMSDVPYSIEQAAFILSELLGQGERDYFSGLAQYNAGPGNVDIGSDYATQVLSRIGMK